MSAHGLRAVDHDLRGVLTNHFGRPRPITGIVPETVDEAMDALEAEFPEEES